MASMPYYMSQGVNELTIKGVEKAINGLIQMLVMSVTGVQELVLFIINLLTSTYVCLITLAVGGSLHVAVSVAEDVGDFLNSTIKDVGKEIGDAADGLQGVIERHSPQAVGVLASARLTNEENYLIQKLARTGLKTNSVHSCEAT